MGIRRLIIGVTLIFLPCRGLAVDSMEALRDEAVRVNPEVEALSYQMMALTARADASRSFEDPVLSVEYSNFPWNTWSLGDSPMTGIQLKVRQTFPFPGKNDRRQATVLAESEVKRLELEELRVQLRGMVGQEYLRLVLVRQLKRLTEEHIGLVFELRQRVKLRYEVGRGNLEDMVRLDLLKEKLVDDLNDFESKDAEITAAINGVLHREITKEIPTPLKIHIGEPRHSLLHLQKAAAEYRPLLTMWKQRATVSHLRADQTEWERRPDLSVWLGYRFRTGAGMDDGTDFLSLGASVPLPFDYLSSRDAKKEESLLTAFASNQHYLVHVDKISAELQKSLVAWKRAVKKAKTYREKLVIGASKTFTSALLAYENDRTSFYSVYRAQVDLIEYERAIRIAEIEAAGMKIEIETLVGVDLEKGDTKRSDP